MSRLTTRAGRKRLTFGAGRAPIGGLLVAGEVDMRLLGTRVEPARLEGDLRILVAGLPGAAGRHPLNRMLAPLGALDQRAGEVELEYLGQGALLVVLDHERLADPLGRARAGRLVVLAVHLYGNLAEQPEEALADLAGAGIVFGAARQGRRQGRRRRGASCRG